MSRIGCVRKQNWLDLFHTPFLRVLDIGEQVAAEREDQRETCSGTVLKA